jgi:hypothetical protein
VIRLDIPLFEHLQDAISAPQEAQLLELLREFDAAMLELDDQHQLPVAADAILQLATIVEAKYVGVIEQVKAQVRSGASSDPIVPNDFFDRFVRQSMVVNFDQFIEPVSKRSLPLDGEWEMRSGYRAAPLTDFYADDPARACEVLDAVIDDAAAMLDALPDRSAHLPDFDALLDLSHGEGIGTWTQELVSMMEKLQNRKRQPISLLDLICTLEGSRTDSERKECLIDLWLAFLLGKHAYALRRTAHDFYSPVGIEIVVYD